MRMLSITMSPSAGWLAMEYARFTSSSSFLPTKSKNGGFGPSEDTAGAPQPRMPAAPAIESVRGAVVELGLVPDRGVRVRVTGAPALANEELDSEISKELDQNGKFIDTLKKIESATKDSSSTRKA